MLPSTDIVRESLVEFVSPLQRMVLMHAGASKEGGDRNVDATSGETLPAASRAAQCACMAERGHVHVVDVVQGVPGCTSMCEAVSGTVVGLLQSMTAFTCFHMSDYDRQRQLGKPKRKTVASARV